MIRGLVFVCLGGLLCCVLAGPVLVHAQDYFEWRGCGGAVSAFPEAAARQVCGNDECSGDRPNLLGEYPGTGTYWQFGCCTGPGWGCQWMSVTRYGSQCPPGTEYMGDPWFGCVGPEPVPPATADDPCVGANQPPGTSRVVDVTNCSVYVNAGGVGVCLGDGSSCWNMYCPTGDTEPSCTPQGAVPPTNPDDPPYSAVPTNFAPADDCTAGCGGSEPGERPPPDAGEPKDPSDPSQGNYGDEPVSESSTTSTAPDGTTTTVENGINFNPYSGARTETTKTTTTSPDGTTVEETKTTTTKPTDGAGGTGGKTTTTTVVRTTTAPDGTTTTEVSGSTKTEDQGVEEESKTSAKGGISCESEPECSGDPIQCAIFKQAWRQNCVFGKVSGGDSCDAPPTCDISQLGCYVVRQMWEDRCPPTTVDTAGVQAALDGVLPENMLTGAKVEAAVAADGDYQQTEEIDLGAFSTGPQDPAPSGSCPLPITLEVLDVSVDIGDADLCELLSYISWLVHISASLLAVGIVTGVHITKSRATA